MKRILMTLSFVLMAVASWAHDVEVDGIYYSLNRSNNTATVTYNQIRPGIITSSYSGNVVIPDEISVDGVTFTVTRIGHSAFDSCKDLTSVIIGNSVKTIEFWAFVECTGLTSVTIGSSVENVNLDVFWGCTSLPSVTIPNSVTRIGHSCFEYCKELKDVTVEWEEPLFVDSWNMIFSSVPLNMATLHVPVGTADKYRVAETWREFKNVEEYDPTDILHVENGKPEVMNGKYLHNGRVVIMKDGEKYTLDGKISY